MSGLRTVPGAFPPPPEDPPMPTTAGDRRSRDRSGGRRKPAAAAAGDGRRRRKERVRGGAALDGAEDVRKKRRKKSAGAAAAAAAAASTAGPGAGVGGRAKRGSDERREKKGVAADGVGDGEVRTRQKRKGCPKCLWILLAATILLMIVLIPVGVLVIGKKKEIPTTESSSKGGESADFDPSSIPTEAKGTYLDPAIWLDRSDFNLTYTDKKVGGLPVMGLYDDYDDSVQANDQVPALNADFDYGKLPIRGVNIGGWLVVEPFITPSFFKKYDESLGVVDEWTLSEHLGHDEAASTLEKHYSTFVTADTFKEVREAGLDHVRIPFGYWAAMVIEGDAFVPQISFRYLIRGIEWARKQGLRVFLDLHSVPGGANGWNHSGRQGVLQWLNGTNGEANAQKTLELHTQLATFFSQDRYKNIVTLYGLVNEPKMTTLDPVKVISWSEDAFQVIRQAGYKGKIIFGDGFRGLSKWKGAFDGLDGMLLDVHQYVIFNTQQISLSHEDKVKFACQTWGNQMAASMDTSTGFGPTLVGEWSQADTDCTEYLNNVGVGSRWEGTLDMNDVTQDVLSPCCNGGKDCSCDKANADPSDYSDEYRDFLLMFAEAQMESFEVGWGWMYWTWDTEDSAQWSYKKGLAAGILPDKPWNRKFSCADSDIPDFEDEGLPETY